ncbi:MAG: hypothetical protein KatS3mg111_0794 [Pirellulaceae bacterium]|nr:MAG: hypothetical protein KatS3mg111_0794 [Pirellulaceae bacterium]
MKVAAVPRPLSASGNGSEAIGSVVARHGYQQPYAITPIYVDS